VSQVSSGLKCFITNFKNYDEKPTSQDCTKEIAKTAVEFGKHFFDISDTPETDSFSCFSLNYTDKAANNTAKSIGSCIFSSIKACDLKIKDEAKDAFAKTGCNQCEKDNCNEPKIAPLKCYVTNFKNVDEKPTSQACTKDIAKTAVEFGKQLFDIPDTPESDSFSCFSLNYTDRADYYKEKSVGSCIFSSIKACDLEIKDSAKPLFAKTGCEQCEKDNCNVITPPTTSGLKCYVTNFQKLDEKPTSQNCNRGLAEVTMSIVETYFDVPNKTSTDSFNCLRLELTDKKDKSETLSSCIFSHMKVCDLKLKDGADKLITKKSCSQCEKDNCNSSAGSLTISLTLISAMLVTIVKMF